MIIDEYSKIMPGHLIGDINDDGGITMMMTMMTKRIIPGHLIGDINRFLFSRIQAQHAHRLLVS